MLCKYRGDAQAECTNNVFVLFNVYVIGLVVTATETINVFF